MNKNLQKAKAAKNDEFYTQLKDIEKELIYYKDFLEDKIIYCNCDNPEWSNFWKYFKDNFKTLKIKKLISTYYEEDKTTYKTEYDGIDIIKTKLKGNGDFRNDECIEILKSADIVITNPPFSLFREYISQLMLYEKKFLIIGNQNAITYKNIFPFIKEEKIKLGYTIPKDFSTPEKEICKKMNSLCRWYSNLDITKLYTNITLTKKYNKKDYPKYDNYNCINVNKVKDIPKNYKGEMGVPITFLDKYNPKQFKIIGLSGVDVKMSKNRPYINKKRIYLRIIIKKI